jgi:hypothetical protein
VVFAMNSNQTPMGLKELKIWEISKEGEPPSPPLVLVLKPLKRD